ncbi:MAG: hypothetical protein L3V56_14265 [Candidatus Magnetoovum sp. WYHC-5]|nr:hypothetical protein [Candidatus Magnetoovum sp. WYHC-5]
MPKRIYKDIADKQKAGYGEIIPFKKHRSVGKESGKTNYLVRKTLSFSKKIVNHIRSIWYFIHNYNDSLGYEVSI